jgi:hypothetical protein
MQANAEHLLARLVVAAGEATEAHIAAGLTNR